MNCSICGKPVVLVPSATERARTDVTGKTAEYYTSLFPTHADCALAERAAQTNELIRRGRCDDSRK